MRPVMAAVLFGIAACFQVRIVLTFYLMKDEVNAVLPQESQIPQIGTSFRQGGVIQLHRRFFPGSELRRRLFISWACQVASFLAALGCVIRVHTS
jgi:hypothetical protein